MVPADVRWNLYGGAEASQKLSIDGLTVEGKF